MGSSWNSSAEQLTGMPELVLMPAPVTTTTFLALTSAFAMSWRDSALSGCTSRVGISGRLKTPRRSEEGD